MEKDTKKKGREITNLELVYQDKDDLLKLANSDEFVEFILLDCLDTIKKAVKEDLEKVELFNILNLSLIVELEKQSFKPVLERIIEHFVEIEDYDTCIEVQQIIKTL